MPVFQIELESIEIFENGYAEDTGSLNLLSFKLDYPSGGVVSLETVKKIILRDKSIADFKKKSFSDRILFKNEILGETELTVQLSAQIKATKITQIVKSLAKAGALASVGLLSGGAGITILAAASKNVIGSVFDLIGNKDKVVLIGEAKVLLDSSNMPERIELFPTLKKEVVLTQKIRNDGKITFREIVLDKNLRNGTITLNIKNLSSSESDNIEYASI